MFVPFLLFLLSPGLPRSPLVLDMHNAFACFRCLRGGCSTRLGHVGVMDAFCRVGGYFSSVRNLAIPSSEACPLLLRASVCVLSDVLVDIMGHPSSVLIPRFLLSSSGAESATLAMPVGCSCDKSLENKPKYYHCTNQDGLYEGGCQELLFWQEADQILYKYRFGGTHR